ncbi:MAG: transporter substrate-binding domain-containing protein [Defluviicoccus sp.]|nr:transporter substrate-binding domain-containing protein [Defluviicoccus sp.]
MMKPQFALALCTALAMSAPAVATCPDESTTLRFGFYAHFNPVSYSADRDPAALGFNVHLGYEADLLSALEATSGTNLKFKRTGIAVWDRIWLLAANSRYDVVGGGITILPARTRDASGKRAIAFTRGHIRFRQSLLVRVKDASRLSRYADLTSRDRVGVVRGTTGEIRLFELMRHALPRVIAFPDETALIEALLEGSIDAVARGEIGNRAVERLYAGQLRVTALDTRVETGGFAVAAKNTALAACIDRHISHLTDNARIGYGAWLADPTVFMRRARQ